MKVELVKDSSQDTKPTEKLFKARLIKPPFPKFKNKVELNEITEFDDEKGEEVIFA